MSSQADTTIVTPADLAGRPATVLKDDGPSAALVLRYDLPGGPVVVKEWKPAGASRLMGLWARIIMRREIRHYRLLDGTPGVPRYRGHAGSTTLFLSYVEGRPLHRDLPPELLRAGLDGLERTLEALHARRFAHLDLHQKLNALIDDRGQAWVIDLGQGLDCSRGILRGWLFPLLRRIDEAAILKFRARYAPDSLPAERRAEVVARHGGRRERWPKVLGRKLRRIILGQG